MTGGVDRSAWPDDVRWVVLPPHDGRILPRWPAAAVPMEVAVRFA